MISDRLANLIEGQSTAGQELIEKHPALSAAAKKLFAKIRRKRRFPDNEWWSVPLKIRQELLARAMVKHSPGGWVEPSSYAFESLSDELAAAL